MRIKLQFVCAFLFVSVQFTTSNNHENDRYGTSNTPLPFPPCFASDVKCLRRGLRTFFFLMNAGYMDMKPIDPAILTSVAVNFPDQQLDLRLRRINVTGVTWTKLLERKFNLPGGKSSVMFNSDLHVTADILMSVAGRFDPYWANITMDINAVESNITYSWYGIKGVDSEDYILIGQERVAVRNGRTPTYFLQPTGEDAYMIEQILEARPAILDHLSKEITVSLMHTIFANFRLFAGKIPVKYYYKYT